MKKIISIRGSVLACALAVAVGLCLCAGPALATTHEVTDPQDWDDGACTAEDCTLREAIKYAGSGDTVTFADNDTYTLTLGEIVIDKDLIIDGLDGAAPGNTIITAGGNSRVFKITSGTVTIKDLTITNGYVASDPGGGGIQNDGTLTLENVVVSNCEADTITGGGICNRGTLNAYDCLITGNSSTGALQGGGIVNKTSAGTPILNMYDTVVSLNTAGSSGGGMYSYQGEVHLERCTFDQNQTGAGIAYGGAVFLGEDTAYILDCTFSDNTSTNDGGAVYAQSTNCGISRSTFVNNEAGERGGAIYQVYSVIHVDNSTFSDNTAYENGGALYIAYIEDSPASHLSFVTITNNTADADCDGGGTCEDGNGGGLYFQGGTLRLKGVILAGNSDRSNTLKIPEISLNSGTLQTYGYNLIGSNFGSGTVFPEGAPNANLDYAGTSAAPLTCALGALADNGGQTRTCALSAGSLAINHGPPDRLTAVGDPVDTDQRGMPRIKGGRADIGAYEVPAGSGAPLAMLLD